MGLISNGVLQYNTRKISFQMKNVHNYIGNWFLIDSLETKEEKYW